MLKKISLRIFFYKNKLRIKKGNNKETIKFFRLVKKLNKNKKIGKQINKKIFHNIILQIV